MIINNVGIALDSTTVTVTWETPYEYSWIIAGNVIYGPTTDTILTINRPPAGTTVSVISDDSISHNYEADLARADVIKRSVSISFSGVDGATGYRVLVDDDVVGNVGADGSATYTYTTPTILTEDFHSVGVQYADSVGNWGDQQNKYYIWTYTIPDNTTYTVTAPSAGTVRIIG